MWNSAPATRASLPMVPSDPVLGTTSPAQAAPVPATPATPLQAAPSAPATYAPASRQGGGRQGTEPRTGRGAWLWARGTGPRAQSITTWLRIAQSTETWPLPSQRGWMRRVRVALTMLIIWAVWFRGIIQRGSSAGTVPSPERSTAIAHGATSTTTPCRALGLPQPVENIPLSPTAYEFDHSTPTNKYFVATADRDVRPPVLVVMPVVPRLVARLNPRTGRVAVRDNGGIWTRVAESEPRDGIFVDVGGWVGDTSLPSAAAGIDTYVFEPVRANCNLIHIGRMSNGCAVEEHLTIVNALVGDRDSRNESVYVTADRSDNAALSKETATAIVGGREGDYEQPVEMIALDSFFPPGTRVQNLKIDVQGFEWGVLRGAERILTENRERLRLRFEHVEKLLVAAGTRPSDVIEYVTGLGYELVGRDEADLVWRGEREPQH